MNKILLAMTVLFIGHVVSGQGTSNSDYGFNRQSGLSQSMQIGQTHLLNVLIQKANQQQQATSNLSHQLTAATSNLSHQLADQRVYMVSNISQQLRNVDQRLHVINNISQQLTVVGQKVNAIDTVSQQLTDINQKVNTINTVSQQLTNIGQNIDNLTKSLDAVSQQVTFVPPGKAS